MPRWPLRRLLLVDALTCAVMGPVLIAGARHLEQLTRIPGTLLFWLGLVVLPAAVFMAVTALRNPVPPLGATIVIAGNGLWVSGSLLLLALPWISPNALGAAFIAAQAAAVLLLALLEWRALGTASAAGAR